MRVWWLVLLLAVIVIVPFLIWGDFFMSLFSAEGGLAWLQDWGAWAWAAGVAALVLDLFLPIPATVVMAALGYEYGALLGGTLAATGSVLSGLLAYGLCRSFGHGAALRIAGEKDLARGEAMFARRGGWLVALSRWLPVFPEVVACLAGLTRMPFRAFFAALLCGSLPMGFFYAALGTTGKLAVLLSILFPPISWLIVRPFVIEKQPAKENLEETGKPEINSSE